MISIYEIARQAGVSTATVSRVLNPRERHKVRASTCEKVTAICKAARYRPCAVARGLARGDTANIALILGDSVGDLSSPIFSEFITGLASGFQFRGYNLTLHTVDCREPDYEDRLEDFLFSDYADGYILGNDLITVETADLVCSLGRPVLALVHHIEKAHQMPAVITDDAVALRGFLKCVPEECRGRSLFLGIDGAQESNSSFKYTQIQASLRSLDLPDNFFQREFISASESGFFSSRIVGQEYCEHHLDFLSQFSLIWCESDMLALGISDVLRRRGLCPGKDIRLAGFDNIERILGIEHPQLTTVDYHAREQGAGTADFMLGWIESHEMPEGDFHTESELIERGSCRLGVYKER